MSRAPGEDLFALISVLTPTERRYVKLELQRHRIGETNQSEVLFDAVAEQTRRKSDKATGRQGEKATGRQGDKATGRQGEKATGRQGEKATGRQGEKATGRQGEKATGRQGEKATGRQGDGATGYDEEVIKREYAGYGFVQRLPEAKRELMNVILRAMRQYHAERTPIRRAVTSVVDALFLLRRGQVRWAERLLKEAIAEAELIHHDALHAFALHSMTDLRRQRDDEAKPSTSSSGDELVKAAEALRESAYVESLLDRMQTIVSRYGVTSDPVAKALAADIVVEGEKLFPLSSLSAQTSWLRLLSQKAFFIDNSPDQSLSYDRSRLDVIERNERYRAANIHHWVNLIHSVAIRLIVTGDLAGARPLRDRLRLYWQRDAQNVSPHNKRAAVGQYINIELLLAVQDMNTDDIRSALPQIRALLHYHEEEGRTELGLACWFNLGLLDFAYERYRDAIRQLNEIDEFREGMREDIKRASVYLRMLCHIEQGHDGVVESMVRRQRRLVKGTTLPRDEEIFLNVASKFLTLRPGKQLLDFLQASLQELTPNGAQQVPSQTTYMFGFSAWLRSHIERKPWRSLL